MSCGVGHWLGSDPTLLWLWCRPASTALIRSLAWEPPYAMRSGPKKVKKKKRPPQKNLFSCSVVCLFFMVSFAVKTFLDIVSSYLFISVFIFISLADGPKSCCCDLCQRVFDPCFTLRILFSLIFRSLTHFEFIFIYSVRECSNFILLHVAVQISQVHLLKRLFLHCISLPPLS